MKFEVETKGVEKTASLLAGLGERASDVSPIANEVAAVVGESNKRRFATGGSGSWAPLAPETVRQKGSSRIMVDTGTLEREMANPQVLQSASDEIAIGGTDVDYAGFHASGTKNMPQRKLTELRPDDRKKITALVEGYVAKGKT